MFFNLPHGHLLKHLLLVVLLISSWNLFAQENHIEIRKSFPQIVESEQMCSNLAKELLKLDSSNYYLIAYRGGVNIVLADFASSAKSKMNYFSSGKKDLEFAIEKKPNNVEIRFVRFTIQQKVPKQLRYKNESEDLPFIIDNLSDIIDNTYKKHIKEKLIESGKCSEDQLQILKQK